MSNQENPAPRRRLASFKVAIKYAGVGRTRAYELIAAGLIRAVKLGNSTLIDLDSVDQFHASLPPVVSRAAERRVR